MEREPIDRIAERHALSLPRRVAELVDPARLREVFRRVFQVRLGLDHEPDAAKLVLAGPGRADHPWFRPVAAEVDLVLAHSFLLGETEIPQEPDRFLQVGISVIGVSYAPKVDLSWC